MKKMVFCFILLGLYATATAAVDPATIYFPFEGVDNGIGSEPWKNQGAISTGEDPYYVGTLSGFPTTQIAPGMGIKGNAFDQRHMTHKGWANTYQWGEDGHPAVAPYVLENELTNIWSFTATGWIKSDQAGGTQNRIIATTPFEINWRGNFMEIRIDRNGGFVKNIDNGGGTNFGASDWLFFALVYDGTVNGGTEGLVSLYYGSETTPVTFDSSWTFTPSDGNGRLERDGRGAPLVFGNAGYQSTRPLVGMLDEMRIWTGRVDSSDDSGVLSSSELEEIRQFDVIPEPVTMVLLGLGAVLARRKA